MTDTECFCHSGGDAAERAVSRELIEAVQEKSGFNPNVFLVLAHRPEKFRAFFAYHDALMDKPGNLTKAERKMNVVATSNVNIASTVSSTTWARPVSAPGRKTPLGTRVKVRLCRWRGNSAKVSLAPGDDCS